MSANAVVAYALSIAVAGLIIVGEFGVAAGLALFVVIITGESIVDAIEKANKR